MTTRALVADDDRGALGPCRPPSSPSCQAVKRPLWPCRSKPPSCSADPSAVKLEVSLLGDEPSVIDASTEMLGCELSLDEGAADVLGELTNTLAGRIPAS